MQKYYNPYYDYLKDERIELIDESSNNGLHLLSFYLHPKDIIECPICSSTNIIKSGTRNRKINIQIFRYENTMILLKVHRFECKTCGSYFMDKTSAVNDNSNIPLITKIRIMDDLKRRISFKDVAIEHNLDTKTVIDIFNKYYVVPKYSLGDTISLDEIKNLKNAEGNYSLIIYNPLESKIIDMLEDRRSNYIYDYFYNIEYEKRAKVKYFITDMYEPYRKLKCDLFNNATHVVDCFHYSRYINDALSSVRIRIMNMYNINDPEYRILKSNWKLIELRKNDVNSNYLIYNPIRKRKTYSFVILDDILNLNSELSEAYSLFQEFYYGIDYIKYEESRKWLDSFIIKMINSKINEFIEVAHTFINWEEEILNSFIRFGDKRLNNSPSEGINSYIKDMIRISRGYKDFNLFRKRMIYVINKDYKFRN